MVWVGWGGVGGGVVLLSRSNTLIDDVAIECFYEYARAAQEISLMMVMLRHEPSRF